MNRHYDEFILYLEKEDKIKCIEFALSKLSSGELDVVTLYEEVLRPALNNIDCDIKAGKLCIWKEHVRSSIVRTIIECCYSFVIKEKERKGFQSSKGLAVVLCPDGETHELGARMVSDYFVLCGCDSVFIGSSTPKDEFLDIVKELKPDYIALSVTNYFNLVAAQKTIKALKDIGNGSFKILVGGNAFIKNPKAFEEMGADFLLQCFDDINSVTVGGA